MLVMRHHITPCQGNQVALSNTASFLPLVLVFVEQLAERNPSKSPPNPSHTIPVFLEASSQATLPDMVIPVGRYPTWWSGNTPSNEEALIRVRMAHTNSKSKPVRPSERHTNTDAKRRDGCKVRTPMQTTMDRNGNGWKLTMILCCVCCFCFVASVFVTFDTD